MAAAYPAYDSYKDSGVEWWPSIPSHWSVKALKHGLRINNGQDHKDVLADEGYPVYGSGGQFAFASAYLHDGEAILLGRKGTIDKPLHVMGKFWSVDTMFYAVCNASLLSRFAYYYSTTIPFFYFSTATALPSMTQADLKNNPIAFPPLPEQRAIAAFLDEKCAKVDEAVRIKETQMALLRERRQILIQQAVTRGLNPAAPMKDSGIDWIGQIPAHWEVKRGKFLFREINDRSKDGTEELLSVSHTTGVTPRSEKTVTMFMAENYTGAKVCQPGDVVFNTMWTWMGALGVSDFAGLVSPSYGVYRQLITGMFNSQYLEWLLRSNNYIEHYNKVSTGLHSSRLRFYADMFFGMFIGFPSKYEQDEIVDEVKAAASKIESAISIKQDQIAALKEYKTSLINAAVTGKIKVTRG